MQNFTATGKVTKLQRVFKEDYKRVFFVLVVHNRKNKGNSQYTNIPCVIWGNYAESFYNNVDEEDRITISGEINTLYDKETEVQHWNCTIKEFETHVDFGDRLFRVLDLDNIKTLRNIWKSYFGKQFEISDKDLSKCLTVFHDERMTGTIIDKVFKKMFKISDYNVETFIQFTNEEFELGEKGNNDD